MEYIKIGKIVNTHGIKGELRIRSDFEKKDSVFKKDFILYIGEEKIKEIITSYRHHKEFDMVTFLGYSNINEVLKYLKQDVYVNREDLHLNNDEILLDDLIGMKVKNHDEFVGKITNYVYNNSNILLVVSGSKDFYIPYKSNYIIKIDKQNKIIYTENVKDLML